MCHSLTTESLCRATRVSADLNLKRPDGGKVNIEYILDIDNRDYLKNRLDLTVKTSENQALNN